MANGADRPWEHALDIRSLMLPVLLTLFTAGLAGYFGAVDIISGVLMVLAAICLQATANLARAYGDIADRESARRDYYEEKFKQYKMGRQLDPLAATAGNMLAMQLRTMLIAVCAMGLVIGYAFILKCLGTTDFSMQWLAFATYAVLVALVVLRYLGAWQFGYRPYGHVVLFVMLGGSIIGCFYLMTHTFVVPVIYPAIGFAALGVAVAHLNDIARMQTDAELAQTKHARRTAALTLRFEGAIMFQIVAVILAMIWMAAFPIAMGAPFVWNYAFVLFYIPLVRDLIALRRAKPADIPRLQRTLAITVFLLGAAFFFCMAGANLHTLLFFLIV